MGINILDTFSLNFMVFAIDPKGLNLRLYQSLNDN